MALGASSTNIQLHYDTVNIHTTTSNHTCGNQAFFFLFKSFLITHITHPLSFTFHRDFCKDCLNAEHLYSEASNPPDSKYNHADP